MPNVDRDRATEKRSKAACTMCAIFLVLLMLIGFGGWLFDSAPIALPEQDTRHGG